MAHGRRRLIGLNLKPGTVARARAEAGLSLAALARQDITRAALHLIETGKSRATLPTLRLIAQRTGKPLNYFLVPGQDEVLAGQERQLEPGTFEDIELALAQERFADADAAAIALREQLVDPALRARAALMGAEACLRQAMVEPALPLLAEATAFAKDDGDDWMLVDCLDWQAAAGHLLEDPSALATARSALRLAYSLDPVPHRTVVRILGRIGAVCVAQNKWQEAIDAYSKAVEAGAGLLDMSRMAKMYNDLSIAYRRLGQLARALDYARKSVELHELLNDRLSIGRAETNLALVLMRQHDLEPATHRLEHALTLFVESGQTRGLAHILLAQAEVWLEQDNLPMAKAKATEAALLADSLGELASVGEAHQILGAIAANEGDWQSLDVLFSKAISVFAELRVSERLAAAHASYAQALEAKGDTVGALKHWRNAVAATQPEAVKIPGVAQLAKSDSSASA